MAAAPRQLLTFYEGDILKSDERVILHQCNCTTAYAIDGLAGAITRHFPYADPYKHRRGAFRVEDKPGTVRIWGHPQFQGPTFIGLFAQFHSGIPAEGNIFDNMNHRLQWLNQCLHHLSGIHPPIPRVAIPYGIGCGNAGGDWRLVENVIIQWARETGIQVTIYYWFG